MALPTKEQITQSIEAGGNILDPALSNFYPIDGLVGPESYSGGFCIVYPLTDGAEKYAFRVWHTEIDGIKDRLKKISSYLNSINLSYFVEFEFVENALKVSDDEGNEQKIDAVKMKWVDGLNLVQYIDQIVSDSSITDEDKKTAIRNLAQKFRTMVLELHANNISHGDLQHGNICVLDNGMLRLVDYDSVYVPTFIDEIQVTSGMAAYQHPCRKSKVYKADKTDDYFSEQIIYLSLLAFAEDLSLWEPIDERDENSLLFTDKDFTDIESSAVYKKIRGYSQNEEIQVLLDELLNNLKQPDTSTLRPLEKLFTNNYKEAPDSVFLEVDDINGLLGPGKRTYNTTNPQEPVFDEAEARKRYGQQN